MKNPHRETLEGFPALERDGARAHGYTNTLALRRFHHGRRRLTENDEENDDEEATGCQSGKSKGPRGRAMATQHVRALLSLSLSPSGLLPSHSLSVWVTVFIHHSKSSFWQTLPSGLEKTTLIPPVGRAVIILFYFLTRINHSIV